MNQIPTNDARRIPVRWLTSRLRLVPVKKSPVPSRVIDESLPGAGRPYFAAIQNRREQILTDELAM
jgi:hypothetical protein